MTNKPFEKIGRALMVATFMIGLCPIVISASVPANANTNANTSGGMNSKTEKTQSLAGVSHPNSLVELFTSQGCSSCPPTNASVRKASTHDGVLALSYSVDYWDYLGWKDTFGQAKFSKRQRHYGKYFNGSVYTPQIILNGRIHAPRYGLNTLIDDVLHAQHNAKLAAKKQLQFTRCGISLQRATTKTQTKTKGNPTPTPTSIEFSIAPNSFDQAVRVLAITYRPGIESVDVKAGENRGHTIILANIVQDIHELGRAAKNQGFTAMLPIIKPGEAVAVLVQAQYDSPVLDVLNYVPVLSQ